MLDSQSCYACTLAVYASQVLSGWDRARHGPGGDEGVAGVRGVRMLYGGAGGGHGAWDGRVHGGESELTTRVHLSGTGKKCIAGDWKRSENAALVLLRTITYYEGRFVMVIMRSLIGEGIPGRAASEEDMVRFQNRTGVLKELRTQ